MTFEELRDRLIEDGIAEVKEAYEDSDPRQSGAIEGFELCRSLSTRREFATVLMSRTRREQHLHPAKPTQEQQDRYWHHRYATLQVEWVLKCMLVGGWAEPGEMLSSKAAKKVAEVVINDELQQAEE